MFQREAFLAVGGCDERVFIQDQTWIRRMLTRFPIARTRSEIGVEFDGPGRISANHAQMTHDNSAACYGLLRDFPDLPRRIRQICFRSAAKRAWKWDRRLNGARFGETRAFWICLLAYLPLFAGTPGLTLASLQPFHTGTRIRSGYG